MARNSSNASVVSMPLREQATPVSEWIMLTPAKAQELFDKRATNRAVSASQVRRLVRAIKAGEWETSHQGIGINGAGQLFDGQHRCAAIAAAGVAVRVQVTTFPGAGPRSTDLVRKRGVRDVLEIHGFVPVGKGRRYESVVRARQMGLSQSSAALDEPELVRLLQAHRLELDWAVSLPRLRLQAIHAAALAFAWPVDPDGINTVALKLVHNDGLAKGSPLWLLSEDIRRSSSLTIETKERHKNGYAAYPGAFVRALSAMRLWRENKTQSRLVAASLPEGTIPEVIVYWDRLRVKAGLASEVAK